MSCYFEYYNLEVGIFYEVDWKMKDQFIFYGLIIIKFKNIPFPASNNRMLPAEALRSKNIKIRVTNFVRHNRISLFQAAIEFLVTIAMRSCENSAISQIFKWVSGCNGRGTLVVHSATYIRVPKNTNFVFAACLISITTPQGARVNCLQFILKGVDNFGHRVNRQCIVLDGTAYIVDYVGRVVVILLWSFCWFRNQPLRQGYARIEKARQLE